DPLTSPEGTNSLADPEHPSCALYSHASGSGDFLPQATESHSNVHEVHTGRSPLNKHLSRTWRRFAAVHNFQYLRFPDTRHAHHLHGDSPCLNERSKMGEIFLLSEDAN